MNFTEGMADQLRWRIDMPNITNEELLSRVIALEGAVAYTATACSAINPQAKDAIVSALKRDAEIPNNSQHKDAIIRIANIIDSFKNTAI